jgi:hypothetical protein
MRVSHPIGRIGELNRGNIAPVRQIESIGSRDAMVKSDTTLAQIAARFARHDVEWNRGAYVIVDRRTAYSIARLRPIPDIALSCSTGQTSKSGGRLSGTSVG